MFLEATESNVESALAYVEAGFVKLYTSKTAAKFADMFDTWAYHSEAAKAGWKLAAEPVAAPWILS